MSLIASYLPDNRSKNIFLDILALEDICDIDHRQAHSFVQAAMMAFEQNFSNADRSVHGKVFEFVIGEVLARNGIGPLYYQAQMQHVPLANFDWLLYNPVSPVSVSCKTKARDRWKQAAYEALALKKVYPQAVNYLVTIESISNPEDKIKEAPQTLDHFVVATDANFTKAVKKLKKMDFEEAKPTSPIRAGTVVSL